MPAKTTFACPFCGKKIKRLYNLKQHVRTKHDSKDSGIPKMRCPICGFLTVDIEIHTAMFHTRECSLCDFKADSEKELAIHENEKHGGEFLCVTCGKNFSSENSLMRHSHLGEEMGIYRLPYDLQEVFIDNYFSIKTHHNIGKTVDTYNIQWIINPVNSPPDWSQALWNLFEKQRNKFKLNYSHSFILKDKDLKKYRYFHSSYSNNLALPENILIKNYKDMKNFIESLQDTDYLETVRQEKPESNQTVEMIASTTFYVSKISKRVLGRFEKGLPSHLSRNPSLINFKPKNKRTPGCGL